MTAPTNRRSAVAPPDGGSAVPWEEWPSVSRTINKMWDPLNTPHHSIIGLTGSGKSFLAVNGLLKPMCPRDRVLILDTKGDDPLISTTGQGCKSIPRLTWGNTRKREDYDSWWRLDVSDKRSTAQQQVYDALTRVYREGNWVVLFDEIRDVTDPKPPNLGLASWVSPLYRKGRSKNIPVIGLTQAPRWVPADFYDQASFAWIGRLADEQKQKRLLEIGGLSKSYFPVIASLQRREWLVSADNGMHLARTMVKI